MMAKMMVMMVVMRLCLVTALFMVHAPTNF